MSSDSPARCLLREEEAAGRRFQGDYGKKGKHKAKGVVYSSEMQKNHFCTSQKFCLQTVAILDIIERGGCNRK